MLVKSEFYDLFRGSLTLIKCELHAQGRGSYMLMESELHAHFRGSYMLEKCEVVVAKCSTSASYMLRVVGATRSWSSIPIFPWRSDPPRHAVLSVSVGI